MNSSANRIEDSLDDLPIAVLILVDGRVARINDGWTRLTGRTWRDSSGHRWLDAFHADDSVAATSLCEPFFASDADTRDWRLLSLDGEIVWVHARVRHVETAEKKMCVITLNEIGARKAKELRLLHLATHDPATGLAQRHVFMSRIEDAIRTSGSTGEMTAVLYIDLDRFKEVNDRFGHECGDQLLVAVASRIQGAIRPSEALARLGGDELAIMCPSMRSPEQAVQLADRVVQLIGAPFFIDDRVVRIGASVGIAFAKGGSQTASGLVDQADQAMYRAKARGGGRWALSGDHDDATGDAEPDSTNALEQLAVMLQQVEHEATVVIRRVNSPSSAALRDRATRVRELLWEAQALTDVASIDPSI